MKSLPTLFVAAALFFAINGCAQKSKKEVPETKATAANFSGLSQATFAAGCFWHEEALFESVKGIKEAVSGYAGGHTNNPTYEGIETGNTGHAETVNVYYDSSVISFPGLLKVYLAGQDPTQVNGQGPDQGTQYRSIAFYRNNKEKVEIEQAISALKASGKFDRPIAVQVTAFQKFWQAEDYHQDYIKNNPSGGYVQNVSIPEIQHFQHLYPDMIKPDHKF